MSWSPNIRFCWNNLICCVFCMWYWSHSWRLEQCAVKSFPQVCSFLLLNRKFIWIFICAFSVNANSCLLQHLHLQPGWVGLLSNRKKLTKALAPDVTTAMMAIGLWNHLIAVVKKKFEVPRTAPDAHWCHRSSLPFGSMHSRFQWLHVYTFVRTSMKLTAEKNVDDKLLGNLWTPVFSRCRRFWNHLFLFQYWVSKQPKWEQRNPN